MLFCWSLRSWKVWWSKHVFASSIDERAMRMIWWINFHLWLRWNCSIHLRRIFHRTLRREFISNSICFSSLSSGRCDVPKRRSKKWTNLYRWNPRCRWTNSGGKKNCSSRQMFLTDRLFVETPLSVLRWFEREFLHPFLFSRTRWGNSSLNHRSISRSEEVLLH